MPKDTARPSMSSALTGDREDCSLAKLSKVKQVIPVLCLESLMILSKSLFPNANFSLFHQNTHAGMEQPKDRRI